MYVILPSHTSIKQLSVFVETACLICRRQFYFHVQKSIVCWIHGVGVSLVRTGLVVYARVATHRGHRVWTQLVGCRLDDLWAVVWSTGVILKLLNKFVVRGTLLLTDTVIIIFLWIWNTVVMSVELPQKFSPCGMMELK